MYQTMTKKAAITVQVGVGDCAAGLCHGAAPLPAPAWLCRLAELAEVIAPGRPRAPQGAPAARGGVRDPRLGSADPRLSPPRGRLPQKKDFPSNSFYVVVVVKTEDEVCGGALPYYPLSKDASPGTPGSVARPCRRRLGAGDRVRSGVRRGLSPRPGPSSR